jgi:hypothetical protein
MSYISVYRSFITALSLWILAGCASAPLPPVPKDDLKIQQLSAKYQLAVQFNLDNISVSPWDLRFSLHQHFIFGFFMKNFTSCPRR